MKSIHGWDVIPDMNDSRLRLFQVPGVAGRRMRLRRDVGGYLVAFAARYHEKVMPLNEGTYDDWAWAPVRKGRASSKISDHCAGVAMDLNASQEGRQGRGMSWWVKHPIKYARMRRMLRRWRLLEWGGNYRNFIDPMHVTFKYGVTVADVQREMKRMGIKPNGRFRK